ncbi:hypothetical protein [Devosia sp.]|uniref:hypothetical protein n=1 Tax=Devosia sp. TaxID=1871048 RepID=UPI003A9121AA
MPDPHDKLPPADKVPGEVIPDIAETESPTDGGLPEGGLPGMPVSHDPMRSPAPTPHKRDIEPQD